MALHSSRTYVLACTIPAAAFAFATYIWVKRKKKKQRVIHHSCKDDISQINTQTSGGIPDISTPTSNCLTDAPNVVRRSQTDADLDCLIGSVCWMRLADEKTAAVSDFGEADVSKELGCLTEESQEVLNCSQCSNSSVMTTGTTTTVVDDSVCVDDSVHQSSSGDEDDEIIADDSASESTFATNVDFTFTSDTNCSICADVTASTDSWGCALHPDSETTCSTFNESLSELSLTFDDSFIMAESVLVTSAAVERAITEIVSDVVDASLSTLCEDTDSSSCTSLDDRTPEVIELSGSETAPAVVKTEELVGASETNGDDIASDVLDAKPDVEVTVTAALAEFSEKANLCDDFTVKCDVSKEEMQLPRTENQQPGDAQQSQQCLTQDNVKETEMKAEFEQEPPVATSPSLSTEEPELQKLTNGNVTSAYGSCSHSPAEELLESPTTSSFSDLHSEGSTDSGKGGSDINTPTNAETYIANTQFPQMQVYEFEIPHHLCGRMIGYKGQHVRAIKSQTRADITIYCHPYNTLFKMCAVVGSENDIRDALDMIRKRFPLSKYPELTLAQVNVQMLAAIPIPDTLALQLPHGVTCDVILSSLVNAGHFFVQQPTHPTYSSLSQLDHVMLCCYSDATGSPTLPSVNEAGIICAAQTMGGWYRAQVVNVHPDNECDIRFLDYGGYSRESLSNLKQIRSDFMTLPFQASECYLANVSSVDESGWTVEATAYFEELAQGQILQAQIVSYSEDGIPYVQLYRVQGVVTTFINAELVRSGYARWVELQT